MDSGRACRAESVRPARITAVTRITAQRCEAFPDGRRPQNHENVTMNLYELLNSLSDLCERLSRRDPKNYERTLYRLHRRLRGLHPDIQRSIFADIRKLWPDALDPESAE